MNRGAMRDWHPGRALLLLTWLMTTTGFMTLFLGAAYEREGFSARHLLLAQLITQALLILAALWTFREKKFSLVQLSEHRPKLLLYGGGALQAVLLLVMAFVMISWNDEVSNLEQAQYLAQHGLRGWLADYEKINGWLGPHHPPLLALVYGAFYALAGPHLLAGRLFNIACSLAALALSVRVVRRLTDAPTAALSLWCWPLFPLWLFSGTSALMEGPFLLVLMLMVDLFVGYLQQGGAWRAALVGLLLAVGALCRYNAVLFVPGMIVALWLTHRAGQPRKGMIWTLLLPALILLPLIVLAMGSGVLFSQAARLSWMFLLLRPGGVDHLFSIVLPLWSLHFGAHLAPLGLPAFVALWRATTGDRVLLALGGLYLLIAALIIPNPRYLLPSLPFAAAGLARVLQWIERREAGATAVWAATWGAALVLTALVVVDSRLDYFYPFY